MFISCKQENSNSFQKNEKEVIKLEDKKDIIIEKRYETNFKFSTTKKELEEKIQYVLDNQSAYEFSDFAIDLDVVITNVSNDIVNFINTNSINPDSIKGLEKNAVLKNITTYSYGYWSGGTSGFVTYSILVVKKNGKYIAANLAENIEGKYDKIIKLNSDLFLFLGDDKAYSSARFYLAYVIKITDEIDLNYPAFIDRPFLNFYNGEYTYNNNLLKFETEMTQNLKDVFLHEDKYRKFAKDSISSYKLYEMIKGIRYYENRNFILRFNGKNFERYDKKDEIYF